MKDFNQLFNQLNNLLSRQTSLPYSISFRGGNFFDAMAKTAEENAPFGRVAIFYSKQTFANIGKELSLAIRKKGIKTVNVILPQTTKSVDKICNLFNLPEDVRMVFVTDSQNFQTASYYATINQIPCGYLLTNLDIENVICNQATIQNGTTQDTFTLDCPRYVFVNEVAVNSYKNMIPELYTSLLSNVIALIDYKVYCRYNHQQASVCAVNLIENSLAELLTSVEKSSDDIMGLLIYHGFILQTANLLTKGKLNHNSSINWARKVCLIDSGVQNLNEQNAKEQNVNEQNAKEQNLNGLTLQLCIKILQLYSLYFSGKYQNLPKTPCYITRVQQLLDLGLGEETSLLLNFDNQIQIKKGFLSTENSAETQDFMQEAFNQANVAVAMFSIANQRFAKLGGSIDKLITPQLLAKGISSSGDGFGVFNTATLMREVGFMEFLADKTK